MANPRVETSTRFSLCESDRAHLREKPLRLDIWNPYRKPPQVDEARSLRGTSESSLRNSAKKLGVT